MGKDVEMSPWYLTALGIWFVTGLSRSLYEGLKLRKPGMKENQNILHTIMIVMFFMWASWGFMSFSDPFKMNFITWQRYIGLGLFGLGILLFIISETTKKGITDKGFLIDASSIPKDFFKCCPWAWADIRKDILTVASGSDVPGIRQSGIIITGCID